MNFDRFKKSWSEALRDIATKNIVIAVLILSNMLAIFGWFRSHETIVLVPPYLDERVQVSADSASESYKKSWALYVSELVGNVSPGNADFVLEAVEGILAPSAFRSIKAALTDQIQAIKEDSLTVSFEPRQITYEQETDKIFIFGQFQSEGPTGEPRRFMRTYELEVDIRFGRPWVTFFSPYTGTPKTLAQLKLSSAGKDL